MTSSIARGVRLVAAALLGVEIAIHVWLAPDHLREVPYIGVGFIVASALLAVTLAGLLTAPRRLLPWLAGAALCTGMAGLFVISRTVGLPDYHEAWTSDAGLGIAALVPEAAFLLCAVPVVRPFTTRP